jgi:DNA-directed RNA polymerase subunit RPC12/RpoP
MEMYRCTDCKKEFSTFEEFVNHNCPMESVEEIEIKKETDKFKERFDKVFGDDKIEG